MENKLKEGETLFANGRIDEAEEFFLSAIEQDANNKEAYNNLGVIAIKKEDVNSAIECFSRSLKIDPFYKDAIINYAELLCSLNQLQIAKPLLEKVVEKHPDDEEIINLLKSASSPNHVQTKIAVICSPGTDSFLGDIVDFLKTRYEVKECYTTNVQEIISAIMWSNIVWLEWANELTEQITNFPENILKGKHVICRLHSYEVFSGFVSKINWNNISDIIFVAKHIKDFVIQQEPKLTEMIKDIYVVPNGIDLDMFSFKDRTKGKNLAFVGDLNFKKGPVLLLHAFRALVQDDNEYRLFIAGDFQDTRYKLYFSQMIQELGLKNNIICDGRIKDMAGWFEDKHYIVCTSILEGHPISIMEAMACGLKPLIHNYVGARGSYPDKYIWNTIPDFIRLVESDVYDSGEYRAFIVENFPLQKQLSSIEKIINRHDNEQVDNSLATSPSPQERIISMDEQSLTTNTNGHARVYPDEAFSHDPEIRIKVLIQEAIKYLSLEQFDIAKTTLERLAIMTRYTNDSVINKLVELYQRKDDIPKIQSIWKRAAVSAMENNQLDRFLNNCYVSIYSETIFGKSPNYNYSKIDEDINAFIRLSARAHPLNKWVQDNRKKIDCNGQNKKLRIGFLLEGFSQTQAPIQTYFPFAEYYDRNKYEIFFYSRWHMGEENAKREQYDVTATIFKENGCHVRTPDSSLTPMEQVEFLTKQIVNDEIDILIFQTTYFVPPYNFISCLRPAPFQIRMQHQQPEYNKEVDLVFTNRKCFLEVLVKTEKFPMSYNKFTEVNAHKRGDFGIPENAILLISANRESRYNQRIFWDEIATVLKRHPDLYFLAIGLSKIEDLLPNAQKEFEDRIITPGFRTDVMQFLKMSDIYVDIFPAGGGSSLVEAMQVGLPIISFDTDYAKLWSANTENVASLLIDDKATISPYGDINKWHQIMNQLILDSNWRRKIAQSLKIKVTDYEPDRVTSEFFMNVRKSFYEKFVNLSETV